MVKTKFKKAVSLMLAAVMSLTAFMGIGATTAFAAVGEKADVYLVDYPRSGDTNNNGEWGHGNLNYMNGWKGLSTKYTGLRAMGSYSGNIAYCIEPGTGQRTGDTLTEKDENFFNNISPNGTISGDDIRLLIGRILQYGYRGGISTSWKSQNESDANCIAPEGMVINKEAHEVELTYAGQEVAVTETATSFVNERQKVTVSLEKAIEKNDIFNIGNGDEVKNISFGLFAAEELVSTSGTSIPADGLIEIISLSENGKAVIKTDLPFGSYYVKELATDEHYILSDSKYPFTFSYAGQDTETVEIAVNDGKPIENKLIYGSVSGKKITENGEALGGAVIGLFKADETEFTKENALMTATSQKDGSFSFEKVPYGNWLVREIEQPEGFVLDETSYEVKISEVAQVIEVEIVNEYVHGNIKLTKVDEDYPDNKLTGATFEVYKDVNGDGKLDDGDELIGTLNETSTGIYEMKEFLYGKYLVRETKAPEGFELDKGVYSVFIEKDEMTYEVENKAGVGFINTAMKGNLKIVKTSSDGKVEGFTFRVTGVNGYDRSFTTDKNGEIVIEGLRIGDYTVSEVQDSVSASYVLPADKIATVKVGSTTVVEMHNELRDTPKTGDNSNVGLWTALAGLSALGIVGTAVVAYRKKKKEDNE